MLPSLNKGFTYLLTYLHHLIKILNKNIMLLLALCNEQQVQYFLVFMLLEMNWIKLLILITKHININAILLFYFTIMFSSDREFHSLVISFLDHFSVNLFDPLGILFLRIQISYMTPAKAFIILILKIN